jgi:hypothetical protein
MIMYRHDIPLVSAELLGYELGLVVHPDRANLFYNMRVSEKRPPAGYGTRIYDPNFEPNEAFKRLGIPLKFEIKTIEQFESKEELLTEIKEIESKDDDLLLCFHHGALINDPEKDWGHVCVFDRIFEDEIRIIDPSPKHPKWRKVPIKKMFDAMVRHGEQRSAGLWIIRNS